MGMLLGGGNLFNAPTVLKDMKLRSCEQAREGTSFVWVILNFRKKYRSNQIEQKISEFNDNNPKEGKIFIQQIHGFLKDEGHPKKPWYPE